MMTPLARAPSAVTTPSEEEANNLSRSTKKVKTDGMERNPNRATGGDDDGHFEERRKSSYKDKVMGMDSDIFMEGGDLDLEGDISEDDEFDEEQGPWFSMSMKREEASEARKAWRLSLIIKLVGRFMGYQFLGRSPSLWRPQHTITLIDLSNDFFIACLTNR